jgi:hypothetical protein
VSSVLRPVGGQPPGVYWRRRLVLLAIVVVVLLILGRACGVLGGSDPVSDPSPSVSPTASATPTATTTPKPTPSATTKPTATATTAGGACKDSQVRVFATAEDDQNPVGGPVRIRFVVATDSDTTCLRDVGPAANEVVITSEGRRIWSSDDCTPGGEPNVRPISKSAPYAVTVSWQGDVSRPGCPTARPKAPAGSYSVTGRNGDVTGSPDTFTLG